jgi:hypothetical protein
VEGLTWDARMEEILAPQKTRRGEGIPLTRKMMKGRAATQRVAATQDRKTKWARPGRRFAPSCWTEMARRCVDGLKVEKEI